MLVGWGLVLGDIMELVCCKFFGEFIFYCLMLLECFIMVFCINLFIFLVGDLVFVGDVCLGDVIEWWLDVGVLGFLNVLLIGGLRCWVFVIGRGDLSCMGRVWDLGWGLFFGEFVVEGWDMLGSWVCVDEVILIVFLFLIWVFLNVFELWLGLVVCWN